MHHVQAKGKFVKLPPGLVPTDYRELESIFEAADARAGIQHVKQPLPKQARTHEKVHSCSSSCSSAKLHRPHATLLHVHTRNCNACMR